MLDTFKAQLKAKAKTLGVTNLSNKRIDAFAATLEKQNPNLATDDDHGEKVDAFLELVDIKEIAAYDDYKATKARKDGGKPNSEKKEEIEGAGGSGKETGNETGSDDMPAWAKSLMQTVQSLASEKTQSSIRSKIADKLKDKVPEKFYSKRALPEKEEDIDTFIQEVETDWTDLKQENNNLGFANTSTPGGGGTGGSNPSAAAVEKDIEAWAAKGTEAKK